MTDRPDSAADSAANTTTEVQASRLEHHDGVAWLVLDDPEKKVNTLSSRLLGEFEAHLAELEVDPPRGLVIVSGKPSGFVAGADVGELRRLSSPGAVRSLVEAGHGLCRRLEALPFPTIAAIHGPALGGGLELALCCRFRVASDDPATRLGLPEVQLGLIPGMGGTQRLPRLVGVPDALDMILTGRRLRPKKALRMGLVDEVCSHHDLGDAALRLVAAGHRDDHGLAVEKKRGGRRPLAARLAGRAAGLLSRTPAADRLIYDKARQKVRKKTGGHYPAPPAAVDVVRDGMRLPLERALEVEATAFTRLALSDVAANLMRIFFMKNDVEARAAKLARGVEGKAAAPRREGSVGVLGAGLMGAGIAQVLAYKGVPVVMKDRDLPSLGRGLAYAAERFGELRKRRRLTAVEAAEGLTRIYGTVDYRALSRCGIVIEAVFEEMSVKHQVLRESEAVAPEGMIFASNTSTLPIAEIAEAARRPENVIGMHFFSPVHKMPLLEVIRHPGTSEETLAATVALGRTMGKTVIVVDDGPGFFTSRVLGPFMNEAAWMLTEGARVEEIDRALEGWGFPVGPMTLLDEVGLDIAAHAAGTMIQHFGDRVAAPPVFRRMLDDGRAGRKAGRGFYRYGDDGRKAGRGAEAVDDEVYELLDWSAAPIPQEEIVERCWLQMLNETARTMEDGVIENPVDVDIGVIFGLGFPPFRGGILREANRRGLDWVVARLEHYAERHGERLEPAGLLREMAAEGRRFHSEE